MTTLGEVLSSRVRATLLAWVTPRLETRFSLTELARETGLAISSLQHECYKLERLGVLDGRREGTSRRYSVVLGHPLSRPLLNLVIATLGLETMLRDAVQDAGTIDLALIAGPNPMVVGEDLLLVLIGEADLEGMERALQRVAMLLATDIDRFEIAYFQRAEWEQRGPGTHPLMARLDGRPIQRITGIWPPVDVTGG
jgi:DNA-binding transcriptional ArsR family regulator